MSLRDYKALESRLGWDNSIAQELLGVVDQEAVSIELPITGEYNSDAALPPHLTPQMLTWYRKHVATIRGTALQEIRSLFSAIDLGQGQRGFLPEHEYDQISRQKFQQMEHERGIYFSGETVKTKSRTLDEARAQYEQMKMEHGREDANEWAPWIYVTVLTVLAIPELPLNFQSLLTFFATVPVIAVVLAIAIAVGIATSSHIVGTVIKQWGELFGGQVGRRDKMRAARYFALGILLVLVAMALVYFPRTSIFQAALERKRALNETLTLTDYTGLLVSVGGNFLIWLIGVVVAYVAHSHIPGLGAAQRRMLRAQTEVSKLFRELERRNIRHSSRAQQDSANIRTIESRQLRNLPAYVRARSEFEELRGVDNGVVAILEEYRKRLIETRRGPSHQQIIFICDDIHSLTEDKQVKITSSAYQLLKLRLPYA